ncbi:gp53-like domain-containing protein [Campylobacter concisus]|uniref:Putative tail fiber protein gp53-like C-terminal domain-containing protein n=1 Tax=Campylobacter concisus TaxID=199 RepID=A0A1Y5NAV9_9BACT|nr:hypothetical protein [Campylobacter concisus]OUT17897.1 hypothetical protein B9N61_06020 [Campylobacter concisus]
MADKEFTQICKEILGVSKRLEKIEPEELRKIKADIEQISATIAAHKASFDASKEDFDGKYSGITEIINTFDTLKAQIEEVLKSGTINDSTETLISTFSSKKIMNLLNEVKRQFVIGGGGAPLISNLDDTTMLAGFWRTNEQTTGTFPKPYGGSRHAHVLVERVDVNWIKQTIVQISQDGTKPIFYRTNNLDRGWHPWKEVVTADGYNLDILKAATSNSFSNTLVKRDVNGDFTGRWVIASHFLQKTVAQDTHFDENSEIAFRQQQLKEDDPKHIRFVTAKNFAKQISTPLNTANAIVGRDENGDFEGRWITAGHFLMKTNAQDNIFDENSEICFRNAQASEDSPSHMRFTTLAKFKESLGLSRGSVGASGWVGLPKGLILQWGTTQNLGVGEEREIMFPIVFPNWALSVVATPGLPSPNNAITSVHINGFFKEKFTIQNTDTDSAYPAYWIAIGH